jgi:hypothetical protein
MKIVKMGHKYIMKTQWTVTVEEDSETGDLILPLPQELLDLQGWTEGDDLEWTDIGNGAWSITKAKNE